MATFEPSYLSFLDNTKLATRAEQARAALVECNLCPRQCGANRHGGETGYCGTALRAVVSGYDAHFGEEQPLVGRYGSGTIFFSHCNLLCNFCQNYEISHRGQGRAIDADHLAQIMLTLQAMGCHNINFVTPSHVVPQIISAVLIAARKGLRLPLIYNTGGYDSVDTLALLDGIIDIYMPDFKFWEADVAQRFCNAADYVHVAKKAISEMHRQVGDLLMDSCGIAQRGLLVRHLVMPHNLAGTQGVMGFIAERISKNTYVNIMAQYRPCGSASEDPDLSRTITRQEYEKAVQTAIDIGLTRLDQRRRVLIVD